MGWTDSLPGGSYLDSFLHPERGYEEAEKQNQAGWEQAQHYQKPFWQHGLDQYDRLNSATGQLLDPTKLQNEWSAGYEQSPYAKRQLEMNRQQGMESAAAMGLGGSSAALGNIQQGAGDIVARDRQQYLKDLMDKYMAGIGLGSNIYGAGANAGANLGRGAQQFGENQAQLAFNRVNAPGDLIGRFLGSGSSALSNFMGAAGAGGAGGGGAAAAALV